MTEVMKIAAVAVVAVICSSILKKQTPELATVLALTAGAIILGFSLTSLEAVISFMDSLSDTAGLSPAVLSPVLKAPGISIISHITAEICRDSKETGLATIVETSAAALVLLVSLPLLQSVLTTITELI